MSKCSLLVQCSSVGLQTSCQRQEENEGCCDRVWYGPPEQDKVVKEFLQLVVTQVSSALGKFLALWTSAVRATAPSKLCQKFLGSADVNIPLSIGSRDELVINMIPDGTSGCSKYMMTG